MARFDRLGGFSKVLAQIAAAIGRELPHVVQRLWHARSALCPVHALLVRIPVERKGAGQKNDASQIHRPIPGQAPPITRLWSARRATVGRRVGFQSGDPLQPVLQSIFFQLAEFRMPILDLNPQLPESHCARYQAVVAAYSLPP